MGDVVNKTGILSHLLKRKKLRELRRMFDSCWAITVSRPYPFYRFEMVSSPPEVKTEERWEQLDPVLKVLKV